MDDNVFDVIKTVLCILVYCFVLMVVISCGDIDNISFVGGEEKIQQAYIPIEAYKVVRIGEKLDPCASTQTYIIKGLTYEDYTVVEIGGCEDRVRVYVDSRPDLPLPGGDLDE